MAVGIIGKWSSIVDTVGAPVGLGGFPIAPDATIAQSKYKFKMAEQAQQRVNNRQSEQCLV